MSSTSKKNNLNLKYKIYLVTFRYIHVYVYVYMQSKRIQEQISSFILYASISEVIFIFLKNVSEVCVSFNLLADNCLRVS